MGTSFTFVQLERFRREAKKISRESSLTHSEALDRIAEQNGFTNWSLLSKHSRGCTAVATASSKKPSRPAGVDRYYLHGDVAEDDPLKCYCSRCDAFWPLDHLVAASFHAEGKDGERFLSSLARWNWTPVEERGLRYRPDGAPNVLEATARAAQAAYEAARAPFHLWLDSQRDRNDPVGDLAGDILRDERFPIGVKTKREVEEYLNGYGPHVLRAVRQAWREFEGRAVQRRTFSEALAEELKITVTEAEELADAEPIELTGSSGESLSGYEFDFSRYASPKLAAKLMRKRGSLRLTVGPWFFDSILSADLPT